MSGQPEQQLAGQTVDDNTSLLDETEYNRQTSTAAPTVPPVPTSSARAQQALPQPSLAQRAPQPLPTTAERAQAMQGRIESRAQKPLSGKLSKIGQYKATGISVEYSETKVGIMPDVIGTIQDIADSAGVNTGNPEEFSPFIEALVADIYTNAYSDKQTFTGTIRVGDYELERRHIKNAIEPKVGTMHRRFAKAMAPMVVDVLKNSIHTTGSFNELLDRRIMETNVSTREEAASEFDGSDGLVNLDRKSAQRNAERKFLALAKRSDESEKSYYVGNSADAIASSSKGGVEAPRNVV